jgi:hypothetical protein
MSVRLPIAITALVATFAAGIVASQLWVRDARAQAAPFAATIYVPSDGLAFRTFDGRVVARLSHDAHGGVFELYDEHEQAVAHVRADAFSRGPGAAPLPPPAVTSRSKDPDLGF